MHSAVWRYQSTACFHEFVHLDCKHFRINELHSYKKKSLQIHLSQYNSEFSTMVKKSTVENLRSSFHKKTSYLFHCIQHVECSVSMLHPKILVPSITDHSTPPPLCIHPMFDHCVVIVSWQSYRFQRIAALLLLRSPAQT